MMPVSPTNSEDNQNYKVSVIAEGIKNIVEAEVPSFLDFLMENESAKWIIVSDYCLKENAYPNDAIVFTLIPGGKRFTSLDKINRSLPCDLKQSKVRDDVISFLNQRDKFTFAFILNKGKKARFYKSTEEVLAAADRTLLDLEHVEELSRIKHAMQVVRRQCKERSFPLTDFSYVQLISVLAATIGMIISTHQCTEKISWISDRDPILRHWPNLHNALFHANLNSFVQNFSLMPVPQVIEVHDYEAESNPKRQPWFDPYVRLPDHFASTIAQVNFNKAPALYVHSAKHARLHSNVIADNPNVSVLRLKLDHDEKWCSRVLITKTPPLTGCA